MTARTRGHRGQGETVRHEDGVFGNDRKSHTPLGFLLCACSSVSALSVESVTEGS